MNILLREKIFDFSSIFVFLIFFAGSIYIFDLREFDPTQINLHDTIIILLASFRLTRMLLYEKIFSIIRKLINDKCANPIFSSISNLISCPWCTGVWMVLIVIDMQYFVPFGNYLNFILAISGVASILVILVNLLNLQNAILKQKRDGENNH